MTRFLINDMAVKYGIPWVHGAAVSSRGMFASIIPGVTPCYRCLFPASTVWDWRNLRYHWCFVPNYRYYRFLSSDGNNENINRGGNKSNLEQIDIWDTSFFSMDISEGKNPYCPTCVNHQFDFLDRSHSKYPILLFVGEIRSKYNLEKNANLDLIKLGEYQKRNGKVTGNQFLLRFSPNEYISIVIFKDARVLIHGTNDMVKAKSLYSKIHWQLK